MRHMKAMLLGAALMAGTTTLAVAQSVVPVQWGWGQRDNDDRQAFRDGFNQGQQDARHNRRFNPESSRWRERDDREAYRSGYERGFQQIGGYRNGDYGGDRMEMETGTIVAAAAGVGAVEAMAVMALAPRGSTAIRTESMMARVTGAPATAIVQRRTAITNTPTVATAQAMATKITTNKLIVRRMRTDISRATTAVAAGAGTNSTYS